MFPEGLFRTERVQDGGPAKAKVLVAELLKHREERRCTTPEDFLRNVLREFLSREHGGDFVPHVACIRMDAVVVVEKTAGRICADLLLESGSGRAIRAFCGKGGEGEVDVEAGIENLEFCHVASGAEVSNNQRFSRAHPERMRGT